eukprot:246832_1
MAVIVLSASIYTLLSRIGCAVGFFMIINLLIYHCYSVSLAKKNNNKLSITTSLFLSFLLIIISLIGDLDFILISYDKIKSTQRVKCEIYVMIATLSYITSKFVLYMVLSFRLAAFGGSTYEYSKLFLWIWRTVLTMAVICEFYVGFLTENTTIDENTNNMPCRSNFPFTFFGLIAIIDATASIINVYLFARQLKRATKLFSMNKHISNSNTNSLKNTNMNDNDIEKGKTNVTSTDSRKLDAKFLFVARKHFILTTISVGTTFIAMILTIIFSLPVLWINFDYFINILCVILMFSWNKQHYATLCCVKAFK